MNTKETEFVEVRSLEYFWAIYAAAFATSHTSPESAARLADQLLHEHRMRWGE